MGILIERHGLSKENPNPINTDGLVFLGKMYTDPRCSKESSFFCLPENVAEAENGLCGKEARTKENKQEILFPPMGVTKRSVKT